MLILTAGQMREIDRLTVERCGITYPTLMENAGARVVEAIIEKYGPLDGKRFAVFCGKGNNGGDGAVISRLLWLKGAWVEAFLIGRIDDTRGEARSNFEIIKQLSEQAGQRHASRLIFAEINPELPELNDIGGGYEIVIDALFGTGLTRPLEGLYERAILEINILKTHEAAQVVSVDIPSGLSSDTSHPIGPHVQADLTVSLTAPKIGNVLPPACYANGQLVIAPIGTPNWLIDEESGSQVHLVEEGQIAEWLKESLRSPDAHKGSAGDVLLIAGSRGKTGAAALASEAVLRAGAGLVTIATAKSAQPLLITQARTEVMTEALDEIDSGAVSQQAIDRAIQLAADRTVIAIGPGLSSTDERTRRFVREFVERRTAPIVIDADGLNALAPWPEELRGSDRLPIIITPHPGEMARLTGKTNSEVVADRAGIARQFAVNNRIITVIKGGRTIVAAPDGVIYINPNGNAGMATAGSGDVLTGLAAGLLAQWPGEPLQATIAAVYLHGLSGDIAASKLGQRSLIASDITENLSEAIISLGGDAERGRRFGITTI
jgi:ADP-dependent NAD(P)H-hydrate dehydratase / NAD(P)H-hydrate epimerase